MTSLALTLPDPERYRLRLKATLGAVRQARLALGDIEALSRVKDVQFIAQLLAAELASNVLRHSGIPAGTDFELVVDCNEESTRVEIVHRGEGFNPLLFLRDHEINNAHHRGIALVDALADRWGFRNHRGVVSVWFELDLVAGRRPWHGRDPVPRDRARPYQSFSFRSTA